MITSSTGRRLPKSTSTYRTSSQSSELRDQSESKKIFGLVVDRLMLSRIFGGVAPVINLILKESMDAILQKYAPPTFPLGGGGGGGVRARTWMARTWAAALSAALPF